LFPLGPASSDGFARRIAAFLRAAPGRYYLSGLAGSLQPSSSSEFDCCGNFFLPSHIRAVGSITYAQRLEKNPECSFFDPSADPRILPLFKKGSADASAVPSLLAQVWEPALGAQGRTVRRAWRTVDSGSFRTVFQWPRGHHFLREVRAKIRKTDTTARTQMFVLNRSLAPRKTVPERGPAHKGPCIYPGFHPADAESRQLCF